MKKHPTLSISSLLLASIMLTSCLNETEHPEEGENIPALSKQLDADGISVKELDRFWEKWNLVTVRFRKDNGEQRFIYANPLAWETLRKRKLPYPDGAIFGKIAFRTGEDPAFPVSEVPIDPTRIQIMVKDSKRYPDTDGWGYALVVPIESEEIRSAKTDPSRKQALSCHACHRIVPNRDFVFEDFPVFLARSEDPLRLDPHQSNNLFKLKFSDRKLKDLEPRDQKIIKFSKVDLVSEGIKFLSMALFSGSISESAGTLSKYANEDHQIYLLSDPDTGQMMAAFPQNKKRNKNDKLKSEDCDSSVLLIITQYLRFAGLKPGVLIPPNFKDLPTPFAIGRFCKNKLTWTITSPP